MKKIKILIIVEGGIVQSVSTNYEAEIVVVDFDKHGDEPVIVSDILSPDSIIGENEKFHEELYKPKMTDKDEEYARLKLKKLKF